MLLQIADDIMNRGVADGTLDGQPVPQQQGPQPSASIFLQVLHVVPSNGGQTGSLIGGGSIFVSTYQPKPKKIGLYFNN